MENMMQVTVEKIVYPGKSLATHDGRVIFTDEGLPGETVEVRTIKEKKNFIEAETIKILKASQRRVENRCLHYKACSPFQTISYPFQLDVKKSQLKEIFSRKFDLADGESPDIIPSPNIWRYRNKIRLHVVRDEGKAALAYHAPGSQREFAIAGECFLVSEPVNRLLADLLQIIDDKRLTSLEEVEVRESRASGELLLNLFWETPAEPKNFDPILAALLSHHALAGVVCFHNVKASFRETTAWGRNFLEDKIGRNVYHIGARSFFQVNLDLLSRVIDDMKAALKQRSVGRLADLYCGLGTFGIALAEEVKMVVGVESDQDNIRFLKKNLALNRSANFTICEGTSQEWISRILEKKTEAVIFDPPRKGLDPVVIRNLVAHPAHLLIYLSCNPMTLARDLKEFRPAYKISSLRAYDFFPHTPHIETLAILEKK
jgi:23S rRNA (uracil1939-C5)-methyltransferase